MLLLLLLLQLYYRALFDHVSFEKGDVSAIFFFFAYYGKCDSADFLCNYQYSYLRSRCITFLLTFSFLFFFKVKCKSSTDLNVFRVAIVEPAYQTDTAPPFPIMQSVVHAVSDGFFSE